MPAYLIASIEVTDPTQYEEYKRLAGPSVAAYDGKYLVRGGAAEVLEEWWDSEMYASAKGIRHAAARSEMILVEGY